jgi:SAM-dependent methyltransferase
LAAAPSVGCDDGNAGVETLLQDVSRLVEAEAPHLRRLFQVFAQEARFARVWLAPNLGKLAAGDAILEVGAGLMLLSCQLTREGYAVTALEPIAEGFSHFSELQALVMRYAAEQGIAPKILPLPIEELGEDGTFAFAFSVNVMEHVKSVPLALRNASRAVRPGGAYRFTCPNYLFPYEPHFDLPTFFSKELTARLLGARIARSKKVADPAGVWRSLNWITVPGVMREARLIPGVVLGFDRKMFAEALRRAVDDEEFAARRAKWVRLLAKATVALGLHRMTEHLPVRLHPIIDCTVTRSQ